MEEPREPEDKEASEKPKQELEEHQIAEEKAKAVVRLVIKALVELIKESNNEELNTVTHDYIHCFKNFYTLFEMWAYMFSRRRLTPQSVVQVYENAFTTNEWARNSYLQYSAYREAERARKEAEEAASNAIRQQHQELLEMFRDMNTRHVCDSGCNHDDDDEPSTSQPSEVKRRHRKPRKP